MYNVKEMGREAQQEEGREAGEEGEEEVEEVKEALPASLSASHLCTSAAPGASVPALLFWCALCSLWDCVDAITKKARANAPANQALLCKSNVSLDVKERLGNQKKRSESQSAT